MQRWITVLALVVTISTPADGQGILARSRAESLADLNGVHVIVEDLPPVATQAGLTAAAIKSAAESKLASRGVLVLGLGALTMDPRGPTLLIHLDLDLSEPVYFYDVQVQFFQNVNLLGGADMLASSASASTWQKSEFGRIGQFRIASLPQEINKLVDAFATDFLKYNEAPVMDDEEAGEEDPDGAEVDADSSSGDR